MAKQKIWGSAAKQNRAKKRTFNPHDSIYSSNPPTKVSQLINYSMRSCLGMLQKWSRSYEHGPTLARPPAFASLLLCRRASPTSQTRRYAFIAAPKLQFGQPVYETHPHLLKAGEGSVELLGISVLDNC